MKTTAIMMHETGGTDVLKYEQVDLPEPKADELRIKVDAVGLSFGEVLYRMGIYVQKTVLPSSLGNYAVGVVETAGSNASGWKAGDKVTILPSFEMNTHSVYGQHAIVPASAAAPYFEQWTPEENAAIWMQVITAYGALVHNANIQPGEFVLITPATGGVGQAAVQTVKKSGAISITTTRSRAKAALLKELGADHMIVTDEEDLDQRVQEITKGAGVRVAFNAMTGDLTTTLAGSIVAPGGTIIMYGGIGGQETILPYPSLIGRGISIQGYTLYELTYHEENLPALIDFVTSGVADGTYTPNVDKVFEFEQIAAAHDYMTAGSTTGAVILKTAA
ncbi:zinc-dependent alcohol dehydrogenase family protein [Tropicimonas sp. S265A]|uniref:zinc-dependent alcohol dehydrogenase family protein n=1 Tax=Tropicimonas sp. S265A TaxID=3415134 RepID=UPI003C7EA81F